MLSEPIEIAKWIENEKLQRLQRTPEDFKFHGFTIGHCIPPKFESYCKIFHPFGVTEDEEDILEIEQDTLKEYHSKKWDFVTWKSIAEKYGLTFHNEINPQTYVDKFRKIGWQRNLIFPSEGYLPRQILIKLLHLLQEKSPLNEVYIYQIPPHTIWRDNKECDLVKCNFNEVLEYFDKNFIGYLYSIDRSWVIYTDTDLCFTIVGGQKHLIDTLISSELEVLVCIATTRVDNYGDKINVEVPKL